MYSDEYLEFYADQFVVYRLDKHGITLMQYLSAPADYEHLWFKPFPLLPKQQDAMNRYEMEEEARCKKVEASVEHLPRRNGAIVERLHHHRHHRRRFSSMFRKEA
jgi:hypothetical protein